jgi:hypothetical protein
MFVPNRLQEVLSQLMGSTTTLHIVFHSLIQGFSATDEEIKSFVCKKENIKDWRTKNGKA